MTNREWLNTLSYEEWANQFDCFTGLCEDCKFNGVCDGKCAEFITTWLQQPHETTADEDFAEMGFNKNAERQWLIEYENEVGKKYTIFKDGTEFFEGGVFKGSLIDQIRKIADKKRKEMGWK